MTGNNHEDEVVERTLRAAIKTGSARLGPTERIAAVLESRSVHQPLPNLVREQTVRAIRNAAVDRRLERVRGDLQLGSGFSTAVRTARMKAGFSREELADRLSLDVGMLQEAEATTQAVLAWPAESLADVLEVLDIPLHVVRSSLRRTRSRGQTEPAIYEAAASLGDDDSPLSHPTLSHAARILRERGREHLLTSP
jgi:ribosome-binding protein aMBF1 (putative translation factor)